MLRSVHQDASFELSKTVFCHFFILFIIKGVEGVNKFLKQILYQGAKWNKKIGGICFIIICGAFMDTLLCFCASVTDNICASVHICICDG